MKYILIFMTFFIASCATTTEQGAVGVERRQLMIVSSDQVNQMADQAYAKVKSEALDKKELDVNTKLLERVKLISQKIIPQTATFRKDAPNWKWEVHVVSSDILNAYCMPGGKIIFYSGIIEKLGLDDAQIAAIMGHEIAHALREHGRERVSEQMLQQGTLQLLMATGKLDSKYAQLIGMGATMILTLPHSRGQESEADKIGLELMARAGYDPREAVTLWQKMSKAGGNKPPEFMSTHPADERRIHQIQALLPKVEPLFKN